MPWAWIFGTLALLYNPLFRVRLNRSTWTGVNWFTVGAIIVAAAVFLRDNKSATSANLAEAMTLQDAEKIVHDFASVLGAEQPTGEIASYTSRLPQSPQRIVQAMKLWLAHEIKNRSLTEEFRNEIGTAASRLPFFIEDTDARRLNTIYRSNMPTERAGLTTEETIRRANAEGEVFSWGTNATAAGVLRSAFPKALRGKTTVKRSWETIADNLSKAGCSWGLTSAIDSNGRTIWIADAYRVIISPGISRTRCRSGCLTAR